jgi:hypothetical protein
MPYPDIPLLTKDQIDVRVGRTHALKSPEIWKDVVGFEDLYQVSSYGSVRNKDNGTKLIGNTTRGYRYVVLRKNGNQYSPKVHRLVACAFLSNDNNYPCVNHIDGNKTNNNVRNLEWCSYSENSKHAYRIGLQRKMDGAKNHMYGKVGKMNAKSKTTEMFDLSGNLIKAFESAELAVKWLKQNGYPKANFSSISQCCNGIRYRTAYEHIWRHSKGERHGGI